MLTSFQEQNGRFKTGTHWRPKRDHWDREWLRARYEDEKCSAATIAKACGISENGLDP